MAMLILFASAPVLYNYSVQLPPAIMLLSFGDQDPGDGLIYEKPESHRNIGKLLSFGGPHQQYSNPDDELIYEKPESHRNIGKLLRPASLLVGIAIGVGVSLLVFMGCQIYLNVIIRTQVSNEGISVNANEGIPGLPLRFTFQELKEATLNFNKKLGAGGFGCVYLGTLPNGSKIAVKCLEGSRQGQCGFMNEVCIVGSIHHLNLVRLIGFCDDNAGHYFLVYELMTNGSLDRWLYSTKSSNNNTLDWSTRFNIALGVAKGLASLHEECREKIVHLDVKPQNILLDEHFQAKVCDFGLSKFLRPPRESDLMMTTMRGTPGYIAPELLHKCAITDKVDVYSYGIVLLEIVSGRRCVETLTNLNSQLNDIVYLPNIANLMAQEGKAIELMDPHLSGIYNHEEASRVINVALWCIQGNPLLRPSMGNVVQMLNGTIPTSSPPPPPSSKTMCDTSIFPSSFEQSASILSMPR